MFYFVIFVSNEFYQCTFN